MDIKWSFLKDSSLHILCIEAQYINKVVFQLINKESASVFNMVLLNSK